GAIRPTLRLRRRHDGGGVPGLPQREQPRRRGVFFWISSWSAVSTLVAWASVCYIYRCLRYQRIDRNTLPYKAPMQPFLVYFAVVLCFVAFLNGFDAFCLGGFSAKTILPPCIDIPVFLSLLRGYNFVKKSKFVSIFETDIWSEKGGD
ncbi:amino acid permease, partial [Colletotrichum orchidophilum]